MLLFLILIISGGMCAADSCSDEGGCTTSGPYSITTDEKNMPDYKSTINMLQEEIESSYDSLYSYIEESRWNIKKVKLLLVDIDALEQELYYLQLKTTTIATIEKHCNVQEDGTCKLDITLLDSQNEINAQFSKGYQEYIHAGDRFGCSLDALNDLLQKVETGYNVSDEALVLAIQNVKKLRESHYVIGISFQEYNILNIILDNIEEGQKILRDFPYCDTPISDFSTYTWFNDWSSVSKEWVWVAYYNSENPVNLEEAMIQEVCYCPTDSASGCSGSFPSSDYTLISYWNNRPTGTKFMQVKFFYNGSYNGHTRNLIWEMNKKVLEGISATYGEVYTSTSGSGDDYKFGHVIGDHLACCENDDLDFIWGTLHCGGCFAEDESQSQNFVHDER